MAATIAEVKGHSVMLHFAGGLLLPYAYPITIIFVLKEKFGDNVADNVIDRSVAHLDATSYEITEKMKHNRINKKLNKLGVDAESEEGKEIIAQEEKLFEKHNAVTTGPLPEETVEKVPPVEEDEYVDEDAQVIMNKDYFDSIAVSQIGEREGPFNLELKTGNIIVAEIIVGTMEDLVIFEIIDHNGRTKRLRIKYDNIVSCTKRL
jgi:hypothetical protein